MFRNLSKTLCLLLLSAAVISSSYGGEKLRYQMMKGSTYKYVLTTDTKSNQQVSGQEMASKSKSYFRISVAVENTGADAITLVAKVDSNVSNIESMVMKDSALVIKEINGKRVRLILTPLGKTVKTAVIDTIAPSPMTQMAGIGNPGDFLRQLFVKLPEQAVGVGDTWKNTSPDTIKTQGMSLVTKPDVLLKIAGAEKMGGYDCVKITFEGTGSMYGTGSRQGLEFVIDGTTKSKGTAFFAPKEGVLVSTESESTTEMNISGTGEQTFTMTQSSSTSQKMKLAK
ncbi:MAG: hypothetical protein NTZ35_05925 [Ignavibacteriales bacterium]|nr:hypothetical protein [Ignavibacteriales bacterium]